ncbi:MAG: hypothetical protein ABI417_04180 [Coleofasciculaceae cyanobacterium]
MSDTNQGSQKNGKANKHFVGARIPPELYSYYETHLKETGQKPTQLITAALSAYLNVSTTQDDSLGITNDSKRFHELENRITALESSLKEIQLRDTYSTVGAETKTESEFISTIAQEREEPVVIISDNKFDNSSDRDSGDTLAQENNSLSNVDNSVAEKTTEVLDNQNQLSILNESSSDASTTPTKRTLKTNEVPNLPGLENLDPKKIKIKLGNTKNKTIKTTEIGNYRIEFSHQEPGSKGLIFWNVMENN